MSKIIIGVAGGTGSGKTTLAKRLYNEFKPDSLLLSHDYYYRDRPDLSFEERTQVNYDHPNAFETELLIEHLKKLKNGETIYYPTYDYCDHRRSKDLNEAKSASVIIVEGILIFENAELCNMFDVKVYVDTDDDVRFIRRLQRDTKERGRSMQSVITQYLTTVKPMHMRFVEPSRRNADIIVPEGGKNDVAVDTIISGISRAIKNS